MQKNVNVNTLLIAGPHCCFEFPSNDPRPFYFSPGKGKQNKAREKKKKKSDFNRETTGLECKKPVRDQTMLTPSNPLLGLFFAPYSLFDFGQAMQSLTCYRQFDFHQAQFICSQFRSWPGGCSHFLTWTTGTMPPLSLAAA